MFFHKIEIKGKYSATLEAPGIEAVRWLVYEARKRSDVSLIRITNQDGSHCVYAYEDRRWVMSGSIK